jgi:hypothetical protein
VDVGDVLRLSRRSGEADLGGGRKVIEDLPPRRILRSAAAMALIDDDQVEELRRQLSIELLPLLRAGDGLIKPKVDFIRSVDTMMTPVDGGRQCNFGAVLAQRGQ